jgi:hypothetical protein
LSSTWLTVSIWMGSAEEADLLFAVLSGMAVNLNDTVGPLCHSVCYFHILSGMSALYMGVYHSCHRFHHCLSM